MIKKSFIMILVIVILLSLSSCGYVKKFESCHPVNHPMSKWEGSAEGLRFELYIGDDEHENIMVIDYGNKKIPYLVLWHGNYYAQVSINDVRKCSLDKDESDLRQILNLRICWWNIKLINETHFKFTKDEEQISDTKCDIPEVMLPNDIVMTRVQLELSDEDFLQIERDENYDLCPTYRYGTQWISDDNQVLIANIKSNGTYTAGTSKVYFAADPHLVYYIGFFEVNSKAYLIKWEEDSLFNFSKDKFRNATEEWQCEYFENHFTARVIRSNYYAPGHIITFTLVETSQNLND